MSKKLFNNVGRDIKSIAEVTATWILALHVLLGVVIIICGCALISEELAIGWGGFLVGFGMMGFGYIMSRLAVMLLYAYGEMTDCLISIDSKMPNSSNTEKPVQIKEEIKKNPDVITMPRTSPLTHVSSWFRDAKAEEKVIFFCPKCKSTYSEDSGTRNYCPCCRVSLIETQYTRDYWRSLSDTEKDAAREKLAQNL